MFSYKNINEKIHWLNIHCKNDFIITINEDNKFNIRFNGKKIKENLSKYMVNKYLDMYERLLGNGKNLDKLLNIK